MSLKFIYLKKGFTLIELLIVMAIIGILAVISIASFNNYMSKAHLANAKIFAKNFKDTALRQQTAEDKNIIMYSYSFDGNDVQNHTPFIIDNSNNKNHIVNCHNPINISKTNDTPMGIGQSVKLKSSKWERTYCHSLDNDYLKKFTLAYWVKTSKPTFASYFNSFTPVQIPADYSKININSTGNIFIGSPYSQSSQYPIDKKITFDRWHYLVVSYERNTLRFWFDGELFYNKISAPNHPSYITGSNIFLGYYRALNNEILLDDVMLIPYAFDGEKFY